MPVEPVSRHLPHMMPGKYENGAGIAAHVLLLSRGSCQLVARNPGQVSISQMLARTRVPDLHPDLLASSASSQEDLLLAEPGDEGVGSV